MNKSFYNIYIGNGLLQLIAEHDVPFIIIGEKQKLVEVQQESDVILNAIQSLENDEFNRIVVYHKSLAELKELVSSFFEVVVAAGGIVQNDKNEILGIFRRKKWDFPKGKLEEGEKKRECAIREVKEECGLKNLEIIKKLGCTYHVYGSKKDRKLKVSNWYVMHSNDKNLIPQTEEDIEIVKWFKISDFLLHAKPIYSNIKDVFEHYLIKFQ